MSKSTSAISTRAKIFRVSFIILLLPALVTAGWFGYNIYQLSEKRAELKRDYSEANAIYNGLLSVDIWRDHITEIVSLQIEDFELNKMQQDTMRKEINKILNAMITQADEMINEKQEKLKGKVAVNYQPGPSFSPKLFSSFAPNAVPILLIGCFPG